jgi:hypothetical protein
MREKHITGSDYEMKSCIMAEICRSTLSRRKQRDVPVSIFQEETMPRIVAFIKALCWTLTTK